MTELLDPAALSLAGKRDLSRLISRLETAGRDPELAAALDRLLPVTGGHVLGLTGPPGVGKSTLTNALIGRARARGERVAVLAVDPSSRTTGGALLGDRTRLQTDPDDQGVFVRSMAAGSRLGGLSDHALATVLVLRVAFDLVIVESVGIGQSEGDIALACDTLCLCMQPGAGDSLQFMKAGIMELPHVIAVTKADLGPQARRTAAEIAGALSLSRAGRKAPRPEVDLASWRVPVLEISSTEGGGLDLLEGAVASHREVLDQAQGAGLLLARQAQHRDWLVEMVRHRFGTFGLELLASGRTHAGEGQRHAVFSRFNDLEGQLAHLLRQDDPLSP